MVFKIKHQNIYILLLSFFILFGSAEVLRAEKHEKHNETHENEGHSSEKMQPGRFIIDHIGDTYGWHIFSWHDTHVTVPLPIILYSEYSGFHIFMSSRFDHGHASYKNFYICGDEQFRGKIVEDLPDEVLSELPEDKAEELKDGYLPYNISITKNVVGIFFSVILLIWIFRKLAKTYMGNGKKTPKGIQNALEPLILFIRDDIARSAIGDKKHERFMPFLLTVFFFILFNNLLGLIPIFPAGANVTGNITVTMVLALFTFAVTTLNGNKNYWRHIFNTPGVPWPLKFVIPLMPVIEIFGMFTKPFVLMVRLFANIAAGHIIALSFYVLIFVFGQINLYAGYGVSVLSITFTVFMFILELLVAFIQAYVFTLLSALYFGMATEDDH